MSLFDALKENDLNMVKSLIEDGADVNMSNKNGDHTPLSFALCTKSIDVSLIHLLIENGADVNKCNEKFGNSPFTTFITLGGGHHIIKLLMRAEYEDIDVLLEEYILHFENNIKLLMDYNADMNIENDDGDCVLFYVLYYEKVVQGLITCDIENGEQDNKCFSLSVMIKDKFIDIANMLISKGATISKKSHKKLCEKEKTNTICNFCKNEKVYICPQCKLTKYCSEECQKKDWKKGHKIICRLIKTIL